MLRLMSYSITVKAAGGQLTVEHSGEVPDGTYIISGHEDEHGHTMGVTRSDAEGHQVAHASAHHSREH